MSLRLTKLLNARKKKKKMLDVSIPHIQNELTSEKKIREFFAAPVTITEKFDGTKLTLIRNNLPLDINDYSRNWIVSYKGNRIFEEEFAGVNNDMLQHSVGVSQYKRVFDHLRAVHVLDHEDPPHGTELFLEFIQNKPTLTRDYKRFGDMFLIGHSAPQTFIERGYRIATASDDLNITLNDYFCKTLGLKSPPILFEGMLQPTAETVDNIVSTYSDFESSLGGKAEGVVIRSGKQILKVVSFDQYDKATRKCKKLRYALEEPHETRYWTDVRTQAANLVAQHWSDDVGEHLRKLSFAIYGMAEEFLAKNEKKHHVVRRDDLMLTAKMVSEEVCEIKGKTIGLIPMAGCPVHAGHWCLIKNACNENETVYLFVSVKGRGEGRKRIEPGRMLRVWKDLLIPKLPNNVIVRFVDSPMSAAHQFVKNTSTTRKDLQFAFYGDASDVHERWSEEKLQKLYPTLYPTGAVIARDFYRSETVDVSGTQMRQWLSEGSTKLFTSHLPNIFSDDERMQYISILMG